MTKQNREIETDRRHVACRTVLSASFRRLGERLMMERSAFSGAEEPFPCHRKARTASPESLYGGAEKALRRPRKGSFALPENLFRHAEKHNALCDSLLAETLKNLRIRARSSLRAPRRHSRRFAVHIYSSREGRHCINMQYASCRAAEHDTRCGRYGRGQRKYH